MARSLLQIPVLELRQGIRDLDGAMSKREARIQLAFAMDALEREYKATLQSLQEWAKCYETMGEAAAAARVPNLADVLRRIESGAEIRLSTLGYIVDGITGKRSTK